MANRFVSKLKGMNVVVKADPSIPRGGAVAILHEDDLEDFGKVDENDAMRSRLMGSAGKVAIASASLECAYKAAAFAETIKREGIEEAGKRWKCNVGVSASDDSMKDVEDSLSEAYKELQDQTKLIEKLSFGRNNNGDEGVTDEEDN